ncbi:MAG: dockerin type I domain-containing protein [Planctomycetota bacterium]|jgi:hypothetical protein
MTERTGHFDEDLDAGVSTKLSADLEALFEPQLSVPPEIDRAVLDRASRHFAGRHAMWKVAAAAAVVIFAFSLNLTDKPEPADFDRNGRVDILDAFKLAKQIEVASNSTANLDINGDGLINRDDVDTVALAAVSLDKGVL